MHARCIFKIVTQFWFYRHHFKSIFNNLALTYSQTVFCVVLVVYQKNQELEPTPYWPSNTLFIYRLPLFGFGSPFASKALWHLKLREDIFFIRRTIYLKISPKCSLKAVGVCFRNTWQFPRKMPQNHCVSFEACWTQIWQLKIAWICTWGSRRRFLGKFEICSLTLNLSISGF